MIPYMKCPEQASHKFRDYQLPWAGRVIANEYKVSLWND